MKTAAIAESATVTESAGHATMEAAASHAAAAEAATAAAGHAAAMETAAATATKAAATHAASTAVAATAATTHTAATTATTASSTTAASQRHCWRNQGNGRNCQQCDHRLAQHNHSPSRISLPTTTLLQVAIVLENRYRLRQHCYSTLREPSLIKFKFSEQVVRAASRAKSSVADVTWSSESCNERCSSDLILKSAPLRASRRMAASPCVVSILRDAAKRPLLRMRSEIYFTTPKANNPVFQR
jgi:hypothetical protein